MSTSDSTLSPNEKLGKACSYLQYSVKHSNDTKLNKSLNAVTNGFKGIMEYMTSNDQRLNDIQYDVAEIRSDVAEIRSDVAEIRSDVDEIRSDVDEIRSDVAKLDVRFTKVEVDVAEIRSDVANVKADIAEIKSLIIDQNKSLPFTIMKTVETVFQKAIQSTN